MLSSPLSFSEKTKKSEFENIKKIIHITLKISHIRVYYIDNELVMFYTRLDGIFPYNTTSIYKMSNKILEIIINEDFNLPDIMFLYELGSMKKKELKKLNQLIEKTKTSNISLGLIIKWVSLLI